MENENSASNPLDPSEDKRLFGITGNGLSADPASTGAERRPHLAGAVGAALARRGFELGWITRLRDTRALAISAEGRTGLAKTFGIALPA